MLNKTLQNRKSFEENIDILLEELKLAIQWRRPSILLAVNKSKLGQNKAEKALENKLKKEGQNIVEIEVNNERSNIAHLISQTPNTDKVVFFVSNIDWGGGKDGKDAYRAINIHREFFVENKIRAVFWLTINEALNLPTHSPDFWAFRHRVIEFASPRTAKKINLPAGVLIWHTQDSISSRDRLEEKISTRRKMLSELPVTPEASSARTELLYTLGYLYWRLGNTEKASSFLNAGLDLAQNYDLHQLKSPLLNGIAIIRYESEEYQEAVEIYKKAIGGNPQDSLLLMNLSITLYALGRNQEALSLGKRATRMGSAEARVWNSLGYIYLSMGKFDEALPCFEQTVRLAPTAANYYESLAICYGMIGHTDESIHQINKSRKFAGDQDFYANIYEQALLGNTEKLLELLHAALDANQTSKIDIKRDPNINLLLDPSESEALLDSL